LIKEKGFDAVAVEADWPDAYRVNRWVRSVGEDRTEEYYRTMVRGRVSSWNLRDRHMAETLEALIAHFERKGC
jgi:erythromycin esterase-like protein